MFKLVAVSLGLLLTATTASAQQMNAIAQGIAMESHTNAANNTLCGAVSGEKATELAVKANGAKAALIDQMKQSFAFCDKAFATIDPAKIGDQVQVIGRSVTKAWVLFHLALDYGDHYSQAAMMLRLNGIIPPSAQRRAPGE